jgi:hypothetical protein
MVLPIKKSDTRWFDNLLSPQNSKRVPKAISLIGPDAAQHARCEYFVVLALDDISFLQKAEAQPSPAVAKSFHLKKAKQLRYAAAVLEKFFLNGALNHLPIGDAIRQTVTLATNCARSHQNTGISIRVSKGSQRKKPSKHAATGYAWWLLREFGHRGPGLTPDGLWHQLAEILCGQGVNLDYLRDAYKRLKSEFPGGERVVTPQGLDSSPQ